MEYNGKGFRNFTNLPDQPGRPGPAGASPTVGRPTARQPWARLLTAVLDLAAGQAELVRHTERDWASATFAGSRHDITLGFAGAAAAAAGEQFIIALLDHEFALPRYLVADVQISDVDDRQLPQRRLEVTITMLLLDRA